MDDIVVEARIPRELDDAIARLAAAHGKSKSRLVQEVLTAFVLGEEAFATLVAEGRAAVEAGDVLDHDEVMRRVDALLAGKD